MKKGRKDREGKGSESEGGQATQWKVLKGERYSQEGVRKGRRGIEGG